MSIDNMLTAIDAAGFDEKAIFSVLVSHLMKKNNFFVGRTPAFDRFDTGLLALDLSAPTVDAIFLHPGGYVRLQGLEELCGFLSEFVPQGEIEELLGIFGYEAVR